MSPSKPTATQSAQPSASPTPSAEAAPAQPPQPGVDPGDDGVTTNLSEHFDRGGVCNSDVFPAGPVSQEILRQIQKYCAAHTVPDTPPPGPDSPYDGITTSLAEFLSAGEVCFSDVFRAGLPTEPALTEIQAYCATQTPGSSGT